MKWTKIIAFKNDNKKEVGRIEASSSEGVAYFKIIGRIWSWSADEDSILRNEIEKSISSGIKKAVINLSSQGGSVFATNDIVDLLEKFDEVKIKVSSLMASAATYLTSKFYTSIKPNTQGMIHMPMTGIRGNVKAVKADLKLLENITEDYAKAYSKKTGKTVAQIQELWKDGDYWMNAQELLKEGFVDAIEGDVEAFSEEEIMGLVACGAPVIPKKQSKKTQKQNNNKMDREELIALYGLEANATNEQILEAAKQAKVDAVKHRNAEKQKEANKDLEATKKAKDMVKKAFDNKKITADLIPHYEAMATSNHEATKAALDALQPIPELSSQLTPSSTEIEAGREKWTLEDYLEKDPQAYENMKSTNPDAAAKLENDYFGKE